MTQQKETNLSNEVRIAFVRVSPEVKCYIVHFGRLVDGSFSPFTPEYRLLDFIDPNGYITLDDVFSSGMYIRPDNLSKFLASFPASSGFATFEVFNNSLVIGFDYEEPEKETEK